MLGALDLFASPSAQPMLGRALSEGFIENNGIPAFLTMPLGDERAYDLSGSGNPAGTLNGGITTTPVGFGVLGAAWQTDGSTGYASFPQVIPGGDFTALAVCSVPQAPHLRAAIFETADGVSNFTHLCSVRITSALQWDCFFRFGGTQLELTQAGVVVGATYLVAIQRQGSTGSLWVNAVQQKTGTCTGSVAPSQPIQTGKTWDSVFDPTILGLFCVFDFAFTAAQHQDLYSCLRTGEPFPLFQPSLTRRYFPVSAGGPQSVAVPPVDVAVSAVAPTVTLGPINQPAGIANASVSAIAPTVSLGPVSPAVPTLDIPASVVAPSISLGPVSPAAGIASIVVDASPPTIALGGVAASVPAITVAVDAVAPNVENGAIFAAAGVASVAVDDLPPTISLGPVSIAAPVIAVAIDANPPAINLGSVSVAAGLADVLVDVVSPFTQPPQSAEAGILDVAAAVSAPAAGYASYPTIDVWQLDARPTLWILEP